MELRETLGPEFTGCVGVSGGGPGYLRVNPGSPAWSAVLSPTLPSVMHLLSSNLESANLP